MKKIKVILFIVILIIPNIIMFGGFEKNLPNLENRRFQKLADINISNPVQAAKDFKKYYNDNFGYKRTIFKEYSYLKNEILNENPLPNRVIFGKNGWYFLGNSALNVFTNSIQKDISKTESNLFNINLTKITHKLEQTTIPYYCFIAPNKHRAYKHQLPYSIDNKKGKFDNLINHWKTKIKIINPLNKIKNESKFIQTYHKTDSHWNDYGGFIGFNELVKKIKNDFSDVDTLDSDSYFFKTKRVKKMGLSSMINKEIIEDTKTFLLKNDTKSYRVKNSFNRHFKNQSKPYKVLIFRDSFSLAMIQFYRETFGECIFIKSHTPDFNLIKKIKPDLIIWQMVERNLNILCKVKI